MVKLKSFKTTEKERTHMTTKKTSTNGPELAVGTKAPNFQLKDQNGETISLSDFKDKDVVLYFYPKDLTPGCTQEACDFRDSFNRLKKQNVVVLGVSKDDTKLHKKFEEKYNLNFPLLSDDKGKVCDAYGVIQEKSMYGKKYMGISRTTYLIGKDQKIKKVYPKVKVQGHVDQILEDVKEN
jgi:peroxiredoxin Q/BCP